VFDFSAWLSAEVLAELLVEVAGEATGAAAEAGLLAGCTLCGKWRATKALAASRVSLYFSWSLNAAALSFFCFFFKAQCWIQSVLLSFRSTQIFCNWDGAHASSQAPLCSVGKPWIHHLLGETNSRRAPFVIFLQLLLSFLSFSEADLLAAVLLAAPSVDFASQQ